MDETELAKLNEDARKKLDEQADMMKETCLKIAPWGKVLALTWEEFDEFIGLGIVMSRDELPENELRERLRRTPGAWFTCMYDGALGEVRSVPDAPIGNLEIRRVK